MARQHGVIARSQLIELGFNSQAIKRRIANGRLHPVRLGVYAVGRPELTRLGEFMAAVLSCGEGAVLSHCSAAELWGISDEKRALIEVSVPLRRDPRGKGLRVHRRSALLVEDLTVHAGIPVTTAVATLVDIAPSLTRSGPEAAINEGDRLGRFTVGALRSELAHAAAGLTPLRFTHAQVRYEPQEVEATLSAVARRLGSD